jgi:hypothetical protein
MELLKSITGIGNRGDVTIPTYREGEPAQAVPIKPFERLVSDHAGIIAAITEKQEQIRDFEEKAQLHLQGLHEDLERLLYRENTSKDVIYQKILEIFPKADQDALMDALHMKRDPAVFEKLDVRVREHDQEAE